MSEQLPNPAGPEQSLKRPIGLLSEEQAHVPQPIFSEDPAVTRAEKVERNGVSLKEKALDGQEPAAKRVKMDDQVDGAAGNGAEEKKVESRDKVKGIALVKTESVLRVPYISNYSFRLGISSTHIREHLPLQSLMTTLQKDEAK
jgi:tRNA-dihydrouridine synthase 3